MGEEVISGSCMALSESKSDSMSPMFFGASCAFFALGLLSEPNINGGKWLDSRNKILQGSANILGLLVWRVQREEANGVKSELVRKLGNAEREVEELKRRRTEDYKANEKVVSIFSAHEQGWFTERRKLRQHIGALINELRILEKRKDEVIAKTNEQLHEKELLLQSKDNSLKEGVQKNLELEEKLKKAESVSDDLLETAKRVAQEHSAELWKHKTAFIELVSTQRQLEAEMGRAVRQVEAAKQELDLVLEQKEQSVLMTQKLSVELMKMQKDLEQKDNILSAMLRKSKLDTEEKQMLLKEVKLSQTKRKQAELETDRWRAVSEARLERHSLKNMLSKHAKSKLEASFGVVGMHSNATEPACAGRTKSMITQIQYEQPEREGDTEDSSPASEELKTYRTEELDITTLEGWVRSEAEKYATAFERRHHLEIDAFAEQLRLKDEKLESFRWRSLSMELELKRLQAHIEGLNHELSHLRQDNLKLEALSLEREAELHSLQERLALQFKPPNLQKANLKSSSRDVAITHDSIWSKVKIVKRKQGEKEQEPTSCFEISQDAETKKEEEAQIKDQCKDIVLTVHSPNIGFQEEKVVTLDPDSIKEECASREMVMNDDKSTSTSQSLTLSKKVDNTWKMDLHALGVSYKIKILTQQLLMLERLVGKQESHKDSASNDKGHFGIKGFSGLMSFLNKQVTRYSSLQGKTDDLCKRMHENGIDVTSASPCFARKKEETKTLEHFLSETFQLQRYTVATGQKLMEIQSKIASGFVGAVEQVEGPASFDMQRFSESLRSLFREVQRGLEIRISRIIGDLEGTLAREGMIQLRK